MKAFLASLDPTPARIVTALAAMVALCLAGAVPLARFVFARAAMEASMQAEAKLAATVVSQLASQNPELWTFEEARIRGLLTMLAASAEPAWRRVRDRHDALVAEQPAELVPPLLSVSAPIYDSGVVVGRVELGRSQRPLIVDAGLTAIPAAGLGGMAFAVLRLLPLRLLRRATALLRAIGDCSPDPIVVRDVEGRLLFANPAALALIGATPAQGGGRDDLAWPPDPAQAAVARANDRRIIATGQAEVVEEAIVTAALGPRLFRSAKAPLRMDGGAVLGVIAMSSDVTQIKAAEAALQASEQRMRRIFDASPLGIVVLAGADRRIQQANPAFCRMLGDSAADLLGRAMRDLLHPDHAAREDPAGLQELCLVTKAGRTLWLRMSCSVFGETQGDTPLILAVTEDITGQRDLEAALRQAQRLEAVGKLTGGVAHDFNNLLSVITLNAEMLAEDGDAAVARAGSEIGAAAERGADMIRRLLAFARQQKLRAEPVELNTVLLDPAGLLRRTLGEAIRIETSFAPGLWIIRADPSQVQDAVLNLAINARDAMPNGGTLTIATANLTLDAAAAAASDVLPGDYVALSVIDTGDGMAPDVLEHALEPFFTTKPPGAGNGLGLSTIYGFARQSGGTLTICSAPGRGTQVRLLLPRAQETDASAGPKPGLRPVIPGQGHILVVDDDAALRQALVRQIISLGYQASAAGDGPTALALLRSGQRFDLLFTDEVMPGGMSGSELAEAAGALQPGIKVLFTTGFAKPVTEDVSRQILHKPYGRVGLSAAIHAAMAA
ncbi:Histidine kinase [Rhodovastum atsumiense]|uniref:histidine kinase n=1 Tax=Rhodovastum atsumiense TaxID=504468 RepID=A0A5M6IX07_9PROT|nr:PAS domain-containing sensor histidine kinase [Rhodovastum atsumiense]KAA5612864.1 PAS domain-containing protein [Rhodovastum atsumiense]CAH2601066.1 Histidine kinase [Rhodovastum atsumiense]